MVQRCLKNCRISKIFIGVKWEISPQLFCYTASVENADTGFSCFTKQYIERRHRALSVDPA